METKICKRCGRELPTSEYNKHSTNKDGLQSWCRECQSEYGHMRDLHKEGVKYCKKCGKIKSKTEFYPCSHHKDGLQTYCKECDKEHGRLKNGTTGVYKVDPITKLLESYSEEDLIQELRRRSCKVSKLLSDDEILQEIRERGYEGELAVIKVVKI